MRNKAYQRLIQFLEKKSSLVTPETVRELSNNPQKKKTAVQKAFYAFILQEVRLIWDLLQDYSSKIYTNISWTTVAVLFTTMSYLVSPFDLLPDYIIGLGFFDDAVIIGIVVITYRSELEKYKQWRESPQGQIRRAFL